jgi:hypothetical protein
VPGTGALIVALLAALLAAFLLRLWTAFALHPSTPVVPSHEPPRDAEAPFAQVALLQSALIVAALTAVRPRLVPVSAVVVVSLLLVRALAAGRPLRAAARGALGLTAAIAALAVFVRGTVSEWSSETALEAVAPAKGVGVREVLLTVAAGLACLAVPLAFAALYLARRRSPEPSPSATASPRRP